MINIEQVRQDTKGCGNVVHFNNAGAALMPSCVADALRTYISDDELYGGYEIQNKYQDKLNSFYTNAAKLINCTEDEIAFMPSATQAWNTAFYAFSLKPGDKILTSSAEYGSCAIAYLHRAAQAGFTWQSIPDDVHGQLDIQALHDAIDDNVKLISIVHIPTGSGLVNPAIEVGKIAKDNGIPYLLDACQSVGQMPIDVQEIGCDVLSTTGRKYLRGPRGTGFLYVSKAMQKTLIPPQLDQHAAELLSNEQYEIAANAKRYEFWEQHLSGKYALSKAIDYALSQELGTIKDRIYYLADNLRSELSKIQGISVVDVGTEKCGLVTFVSDKLTADFIQTALHKHNINVTVSSGSGSLLQFNNLGLSAVVRASVHYYNTEEEIEKFVKTLRSILNEH